MEARVAFSSLSASDADHNVRLACSHLGGRMVGRTCRAPAPGKGPRNDSLTILPNPDLHLGMGVHLHNAGGDTASALAVKRELADTLPGLIRAERMGGQRAREPLRRAKATTRAKTPPVRAVASAGDHAERERAKATQRRCREVWEACVPTHETLEQYLLGARMLCDLGLGEEAMQDVGFHPALPRWEPCPTGELKADGSARYVHAFTSPAMVALVRDCRTGKAIGLHQTWITPEGRKHPCPDGWDARAYSARKFKGSVGGGCVRLGPPAPDGRRAVAEGVESAMAFTTMMGLPCDAALSAGGLAAYTPPHGTTALVVAHDLERWKATDSPPPGCLGKPRPLDAVHGDTGEHIGNAGWKAGLALANRMAALGIATKLQPAPSGVDWNDTILGGGA